MTGIATAYPMNRWRTALAAQLAGTSDAKIAIIGDSVNAGAYGQGSAIVTDSRQYSTVNLLATALAANGYSVNIGSIFGDQNFSTVDSFIGLSYDPRVVMGSGWSYHNAGVGMGSGQFTLGGDYNFISANANAFQFTPAAAFDTIDVWIIPNAGLGGMNVSVDAGGALGAVVDCSSGSALVPRKETRTTTLGTHTVKLAKSVAGDGKFIQTFAIDTYDSTAKKIRLWNWAFGGSGAIDWSSSANAYNCIPSIGLLAPDLSIIDMGINDANVASPVIATYKTRLQTIHDACAASGDVVFVSSSSMGSANGLANQAAITTAMSDIAIANNRRFIDVWANWGGTGGYTAKNASGWYPVGQTIHPNLSGLNSIANNIYFAVAP